MRLLILFIGTTAILISSCTIQKRTFRNGYYISWNKPIKEKQDQKPETGSNDTIYEIETKTVENLKTLEKTDIPQKSTPNWNSDSLMKEPLRVDTETALVDRTDETTNRLKEESHSIEKWESSERSPNLFAINSFVFAIAYVILIFYAFAVSGVTWAIALAVICFFLALIFAIIGIVKWKRNRDEFWGTFFALMALILLVAGTFALLLAVIGSMGY